MVHRRPTNSDVPVYEIETRAARLRLTPREMCRLAESIEAWFRENREQIIDDVGSELADEALDRGAAAPTHHAGERAAVPARRSSPLRN